MQYEGNKVIVAELSIPNIVTYFRVLLVIAFCILLYTHPLTALCAYAINDILDAVDGYLARKLGQSTTIGKIIDFIVDRSAFAVLNVAAILAYPQYWLIFTIVLVADIMGHYGHLYATLIAKKSSHKDSDEYQPKLLRLYYNNKKFLFFVCAYHDLIYFMILLYHLYPQYKIFYVLIFICLPGLVLKFYIHLLKVYYTFRLAGKIDRQIDVNLH